MKRTLLLLVLCLFTISIHAQTKISGKIFDEYLEPFAGAVIKTANSQTTSNFDGEFTLTLKKSIPVTIEITSVGYQKEIVEVTSYNQELNIILKENNILDEVVISASRTPERILESPVTIERLGIRDIKKGASASFFDGLENLKGVDINVSSLGFKSINTRGFSPFENVRFVQMIDGMDMASPALNFATGDNFGTSELDIESIEVLPGAASALYGANAFNGIMLMKTKSPFNHTGISAKYRTGITSQKSVGNDMFNDVATRMAYKFSDYFAAKAVLAIYRGEEWLANNYDNSTGVGGQIIPGDRSLTNFDGVNIYGDEVSADLRAVARFGGLPAALINTIPENTVVSRDGYNEVDLIENKAKMTKFSGALHYRPWGNDKLEIIWNSRFGIGNNMYHGQNRYLLKDFYAHQHKLEFLGKNFFLRGYYYQSDSGNSYNTRFAGININKLWSSNRQWFGEYLGAYLQTRSHEAARNFANRNMLVPGTPEFKRAFDQVVNDSSVATGAKLDDQSDLYHFDANYNFRDLIDWAEIQVGGSYRTFSLNSNGTVYTDANSKISFDEYGIYSQIQKKMLEDRLKFTGSVRYDKSKNFDGNFSPRVSLSYAFGDEKRRNLRLSYQTAFRNPTTQEQYIGLFTGSSHILGSAPDNLDRYVVTVENRGNAATTLTGNSPYTNGVTAESFAEFRATLDPTKFVKANYDLVKPEEISSFELGYRAMFDIDKNIFELDVNGYYSIYDNLVTFRDVIVPNYGALNNNIPNATAFGAISNGDISRFNVRTNSNADITSYGIGLGINTSVFKNFDLGLSYNWSDFNFDEASDPNFKPGFNLAKHKVKVQFGNENLFKNFGFNINARWQDEFLWQSTFLDGIVDARTVIDAQLNYRIPSMKSRFKIGGTNLGGKEYVSAPGAGRIGSIYYISWTIND